MPVPGPYHDAWWLHINRGAMGNHLVACPFEVVDGQRRQPISFANNRSRRASRPGIEEVMS